MSNKPLATVEVISAWASKINWTQAVGATVMLLTILTGGKVGFDATQQATIVTIIGLLQSGLTILLRTKYTTSITPSSVALTPPNIPPIITKIAAVLVAAFALSSALIGDVALSAGL